METRTCSEGTFPSSASSPGVDAPGGTVPLLPEDEEDTTDEALASSGDEGRDIGGESKEEGVRSKGERPPGDMRLA